jgi:hypothetical protein
MEINNLKQKLYHLVYGREYQNPEERYDEFFFCYNTIFRNVSANLVPTLIKYKDKIKNYCDKNYNEDAKNFVGNTVVRILSNKEYYRTYEDAFGDVATGDNALFSDYGQLWNTRQFFKYDFNPKIIEDYKTKRQYINQMN